MKLIKVSFFGVANILQKHESSSILGVVLPVDYIEDHSIDDNDESKLPKEKLQLEWMYV